MKKELSKLIKQSYSEEEASKYIEFNLTENDSALINSFAKGIFENSPNLHNCCVPMSALWTAIIRDNTNIPVHMIAGSLDMMGRRLFGSNVITEYKKAFSESNLNWDGHCWVVFGDYIGDISLLRTAYSENTPKWLEEMICQKFGKRKGALLAKPSELLKCDLVYTPHYVVKDSEITDLVNSIPEITNHVR